MISPAFFYFIQAKGSFLGLRMSKRHFVYTEYIYIATRIDGIDLR